MSLDIRSRNRWGRKKKQLRSMIDCELASRKSPKWNRTLTSCEQDSRRVPQRLSANLRRLSSHRCLSSLSLLSSSPKNVAALCLKYLENQIVKSIGQVYELEHNYTDRFLFISPMMRHGRERMTLAFPSQLG